MNSLDDLANRVIAEYRKFDMQQADYGKVCSYDPQTDKITLNFEKETRFLDKFKILHELSHRVQRMLMTLYGDTREIELNANKIAAQAYKKLGLDFTDEVTRHINYNNVKQLDPSLSDKEVLRRISGKRELIWRL